MSKFKMDKKNHNFIDSAILNNQTYIDYMERLEKVATSIFEWVNLPSSMDSRALELSLFYYGQASMLYDENYGFINTKASTSGEINIYGLPTTLNCFSYNYNTIRPVYSGLKQNEEDNKQCILVKNTFKRLPTVSTLQLFALRLYEAEQTAYINIKAQKTPVTILCDDTQRLMMTNLYSQYDGNQPFIFGDKKQLSEGSMIKVLKTDAPFIADKIMEYKKEIWNEALTFLGINNIQTEKKERLITSEASQNNELINLNLQSYLIPRQEACKEFNEYFGLTGTDKEISVRLRSDLINSIKNNLSIVNDYNNNGIDDDLEVDYNG